MTRRALYERKKEETERKVRLILLVKFSQIVATLLMIIGTLVLLVILYLKYYP